MNAGAVDSIIGSSEALIAALDAHDIDAIEAALPAFGRSVEALKNPGDWERSPGLRSRFEEAASLVDAALFKVRYLGDRTQQRIDILAAATGRFDCTPSTYARKAR